MTIDYYRSRYRIRNKGVWKCISISENGRRLVEHSDGRGFTVADPEYDTKWRGQIFQSLKTPWKGFLSVFFNYFR